MFGIQQGVAIGVFVKCRPAGQRADWPDQACRCVGIAVGEARACSPWRMSSSCQGSHCSHVRRVHFFVPRRGNRRGRVSPLAASGPDLSAARVGCADQVRCAVRGIHAGGSRTADARSVWLMRLAGVLLRTFPRGCHRRRGACPLMRSGSAPTWSHRGTCVGSTMNPDCSGDRVSGSCVTWTASNMALVFMRQATNPDTYDHFLATRIAGLGSRVLQRSWGSIRGPAVHHARQGPGSRISR